MRNNRKQISESLETLEILYSKIDICFHRDYNLIDDTGTGYIVSGKCHYEVSTENADNLKTLKREFKAELSDILELIADHKGSFFDTTSKRNIDDFHKKRVLELSQNYDNLIELFESVPIKEV